MKFNSSRPTLSIANKKIFRTLAPLINDRVDFRGISLGPISIIVNRFSSTPRTSGSYQFSFQFFPPPPLFHRGTAALLPSPTLAVEKYAYYGAMNSRFTGGGRTRIEARAVARLSRLVHERERNVNNDRSGEGVGFWNLSRENRGLYPL